MGAALPEGYVVLLLLRQAAFCSPALGGMRPYEHVMETCRSATLMTGNTEQPQDKMGDSPNIQRSGGGTPNP